MDDFSYWTRRSVGNRSSSIPRRTLLRSVGMGALASGALAGAGCSSSNNSGNAKSSAQPSSAATRPSVGTTAAASSPSASRPSSSPAAQQIVPKGQITSVLSTGSSLDSFNPLQWMNGYQTVYRDAVSDPLVKIDQNAGKQALINAVAQSYEVTPDGLTTTFHLRPGVTFHDGTPVKASDSKFSFDFVRSDPAKHARKVEWIAVCDNVQAPDDQTVVVHLKRPYSLLVASNGMWPIVSQSAFNAVGLDGFEQKPVSTGPWKFVSGTKGQQVQLTAVTNHYRQTPYAKDYKIVLTPEEASRVAQIQTGEAQLADISPASVKSLDGVNGVKVLRDKGAQSWWLVFMDKAIGKTDSPTNDPRVRTAISKAVNRQAIVSSVLSNEALLQGSFGSRYLPGYVDLSPDPYNLADAKAMLDAAGYGSGFDIDLYTSIITGGPQVNEYTQVMVTDWAKIGVRVRVIQKDAAGMLDMLSGKKSPGMHYFGLRGAYDASQYAIFVNSDGAFSWFRSPAMDALVATIQSGPNVEVRTKAWQDLQQAVYDDGTYKMLWSDNILTAVGKDVKQYQTVPGLGYVLLTEKLQLA